MKRDDNVIGDDIALVPLAAANTEVRALQPEAAACDDTAVALRGSCQRHGDRTRLAADRQCALHFVAIGTDALDRAAGKQGLRKRRLIQPRFVDGHPAGSVVASRQAGRGDAARYPTSRWVTSIQ